MRLFKRGKSEDDPTDAAAADDQSVTEQHDITSDDSPAYESAAPEIYVAPAEIEEPAPAAGRMRGRLFGRLGRSKGGLGAALASVFSG
jgi:hypothetical protein